MVKIFLLILLCADCSWARSFFLPKPDFLQIFVKSNVQDFKAHLLISKFDFDIIPGVRASIKVNPKSLTSKYHFMDELLKKFVLPETFVGHVKKGSYKTTLYEEKERSIELKLPIIVNNKSKIDFDCNLLLKAGEAFMECRAMLWPSALFDKQVPYDYVFVTEPMSLMFSLKLQEKI